MSIFRLVLNMIRITLNFYAQKNTEEFSLQCSGRLRPRALCHPPRTIIAYHNQNYLSSVFQYLAI